MKLNKKVNPNKTNHLLVENELKKLQAFDSSYYQSKNNFEEDGTEDYLLFQRRDKYFEKINNTGSISEWKSKGVSDEVINSPALDDESLAPALTYVGNKI